MRSVDWANQIEIGSFTVEKARTGEDDNDDDDDDRRDRIGSRRRRYTERRRKRKSYRWRDLKKKKKKKGGVGSYVIWLVGLGQLKLRSLSADKPH